MNKFALKIMLAVAKFCATDADLKKTIESLSNELSVWLMKEDLK